MTNRELKLKEITRDFAPALFATLKEATQALELHIDIDSRRLNISAKGYCPCTETVVSDANRMIKQIAMLVDTLGDAA